MPFLAPLRSSQRVQAVMPSKYTRMISASISAVFALFSATAVAAQQYNDGSEPYQPDRYNNQQAQYDDYSRAPRGDAYSNGGGRGDSFSSGNDGGYSGGESYSPPPRRYDDPPPSYGDNQYAPPPPQIDRYYYEESESVRAGHGFFGSVSKGLAKAVEYAFRSEGRPNGYILGEDASGAFFVGLRYGEGRLYTKHSGDHKVYWQGPSLGYDMGAEGSKTMILVYNMRHPGEIYHRFGGAEGSAYLVGGVSVQFQTYNHVKMAVIRSGVGVRLGANIGYSKYSRYPTWNPL